MLGLPLSRNFVGIGRCQPGIVDFHIVTETGAYDQAPTVALRQSDCSIEVVQITATDLQGGESESLPSSVAQLLGGRISCRAAMALAGSDRASPSRNHTMPAKWTCVNRRHPGIVCA